VTERPERLSLKVLMALLDILDCAMDDLIEPAAAATPDVKARTASGEGKPGWAACAPGGHASPEPVNDP